MTTIRFWFRYSKCFTPRWWCYPCYIMGFSYHNLFILLGPLSSLKNSTFIILSIGTILIIFEKYSGHSISVLLFASINVTWNTSCNNAFHICSFIVTWFFKIITTSDQGQRHLPRLETLIIYICFLPVSQIINPTDTFIPTALVSAVGLMKYSWQ